MKTVKKVENKVAIYVEGGIGADKPWVAELVGTDPKYVFKRRYVNMEIDAETGLPVYWCRVGRVYEINEPSKGRYLVKATKDGYIPLTREEALDEIKAVIDMLDNPNRLLTVSVEDELYSVSDGILQREDPITVAETVKTYKVDEDKQYYVLKSEPYEVDTGNRNEIGIPVYEKRFAWVVEKVNADNLLRRPISRAVNSEKPEWDGKTEQELLDWCKSTYHNALSSILG